MICIECLEEKNNTEAAPCNLCDLPICLECRRRHMSREEALLYQIIKAELEAA